MNLVNRYAKTDFDSYEDFSQNFKINVPENFNFGFDIVDEMARLAPEQKALLWCNDKGDERTFTFKDISTLSNKAVTVLTSLGIKKGDTVMLMLKRRYHFWFIMPALHKIGAIAIPSTHMLTEQDIDYRVKTAGVKTLICAADPIVTDHAIKSKALNPDLQLVSVDGVTEGFFDFDKALDAAEEAHPERVTENEDTMLIYFTSGTTSHPKMVQHVFTYPLGHIITAGFWQHLSDNDIHFTLADTGWAKCAWGKIYGQWIMGACVFVYDYDSKFPPAEILKMLSSKCITTFCA
ncbi:MAG: AMP-binding protein, partial [Eubacteriales bacterium]